MLNPVCTRLRPEFLLFMRTYDVTDVSEPTRMMCLLDGAYEFMDENGITSRLAMDVVQQYLRLKGDTK